MAATEQTAASLETTGLDPVLHQTLPEEIPTVPMDVRNAILFLLAAAGDWAFRCM